MPSSAANASCRRSAKLLARALSGTGATVAIAGEPGIGKTHTAQVVAQWAAVRGMQVLWGRCNEEPGAPPYWPWVQLVRGWLQFARRRGGAAGARRRGRAADRDPARHCAAAARLRAAAADRRCHAGALPPVRRHERLLEAGRGRAAAAARSSTTCTGPTRRRCGCWSSWRRTWPPCPCWWSSPTATSSCRASTRCRARWASWRASPASSACD